MLSIATLGGTQMGQLLESAEGEQEKDIFTTTQCHRLRPARLEELEMLEEER